MKILLERAGVHECGVDGVAEKALVYSCKFFWFFFNDCKKNMKKRMNFIRLNIKVKKFKNFPDRVLSTKYPPLLPLQNPGMPAARIRFPLKDVVPDGQLGEVQRQASSSLQIFLRKRSHFLTQGIDHP